MSFPSGHAALSSAAATYSFLLLENIFPPFYRPIVLSLIVIFPIIGSGKKSAKADIDWN